MVRFLENVIFYLDELMSDPKSFGKRELISLKHFLDNSPTFPSFSDLEKIREEDRATTADTYELIEEIRELLTSGKWKNDKVKLIQFKRDLMHQSLQILSIQAKSEKVKKLQFEED